LIRPFHVLPPKKHSNYIGATKGCQGNPHFGAVAYAHSVSGFYADIAFPEPPLFASAHSREGYATSTRQMHPSKRL
jgi:hypothetical protein